MYWPTGAPRVYSASSNKSSKNQTIDSNDEAKQYHESKGDDDFRKNISKFFFQKVKEIKKGSQYEPESGSSTPATQDNCTSSVKSIDQDCQSPHFSTRQNSEEISCSYLDDQPLLSLKVSRSGHLFAVITSVGLTVWQTKPTAILAVFVRSKKSLISYGSNVSLLMRPDSTIFVILTTYGYLITYTLATNPNNRVYKPLFPKITSSQTRIQSKSSGTRSRVEDGVLWGPGEGDGAREMSINFRLVIQVDAGAVKALAFDDELIVATKEPAAVQCIKWVPDSSGSQTSTVLLSKMDWLPNKTSIIDLIHDCPMNLSAWITSDGKAYAVQKSKDTKNVETSHQMFRGFCFHTPTSSGKFAIKAAINARFSLIAIGCVDGTIQIYTAKDYIGNIPPSHTNKSNVDEYISGSITCLTYSPDGYCLFVGYEKGWAMWSVFGKPGATSFEDDNTTSQKQKEGWLSGVREAVWMGGGLEILMISPEDHRIWTLEMIRSAISNCYGPANSSRILLQTTSTIAVYRGNDLPAISAMSNESSLWHVAQVPSSYLADQWPMRYSVISSDGRYVAVAGRRGLTHYSVSSRRWKTFADEIMENEFQIRGGMCWHQHILVAAIEAERVYQLRLFSREADLSTSSTLHSETLPAPIVLITPSGDDSLLVYTYDNILYHYIFTQLSGELRIVQVGQIAFHGIVRSPARVRGLSWILPEDESFYDDPSLEVACATVLFLVDGKLVLLQPLLNEESELRYDMRVIAQNIEYYALTKEPRRLTSLDQKNGLYISSVDKDNPKTNMVTESCLTNSLWMFEGAEIKGWINFQDVLQSTYSEISREIPPMVSIPVDFYPLSVLLERGVIVGLESELVQRRDTNFSLFKLAIRTQLFIPHVLEFHLSRSDHFAALNLAQKYQNLNYFAHSLETLLNNILTREVDSNIIPEESLLPQVISFLSLFPQNLDIIVQCTRKNEIRSWNFLYKFLPPPQELFEESLRKGSLKTAAGYMLVLQSFGEMKISHDQFNRLFLKAKNEGDWMLCKELADFLIALDQSGATLSKAMEMLELKSPKQESKQANICSL
ncbi:RAB6A-GEF complex partner protein 1 [Golovinomyces cichoracearum]|uniref:RAB6A-GEF complex partner protein 1 n=1 Tax=Golovinomyces cichoracearum TaxID=62708 RepID=A0A420HKF7_9PEZI|nr:RAB6A-GEF complex partner protein 1 [Golovinomyces cichoracearum]